LDGSSAPPPKKNLGPRRAYIANNAYRNSASGQDFRTYDFVVGLRVTSTDGMTAEFYPFDMKFIGAVAPASSTR
jgi:GMP synthase PP-ATPase subunit